MRSDAADRRTAAKRPPLWTPTFVLIIAMTLCSFIVGQGTNSGTSVYIDRMGGTTTLAGLLAADFSVAAAVARLVCGPIIDRVGRVRIMGIGAVVMLVGTLGPVVANDTAFFVVWRFLQGAGFSAATTASATAADDVLPHERLGEGIGYYGLGQAISMSVGPAIALWLVATDPAENLYLGLSVAAVLALFFTLGCRYERHPETLPASAAYRVRWEAANAREAERDEGRAARDRARGDGVADDRGADVADGRGAGAAESGGAGTANVDDRGAGVADASARGGVAANVDALTPLEQAEVDDAGGPTPEGLIAAEEPKVGFWRSVFEVRALPGTIPMLILSPAFGFGIFFMGLYGSTLGYGSPGLFYTVSAVAMIAVRLGSGSFMDRVLPIRILGFAIACGVIAYLCELGCGLGWWGGAGEFIFYAAGIPYGLALGLSLPINQSVAVKNSPPERWGATNALFLLASDVGIGTASVIWGIVNDSAGFPMTIVCVLGCIVASFLVAYFIYPPSAKHR